MRRRGVARQDDRQSRERRVQAYRPDGKRTGRIEQVRLIPVAPDRTRVVSEFLLRPETIEADGSGVRDLVEFRDVEVTEKEGLYQVTGHLTQAGAAFRLPLDLALGEEEPDGLLPRRRRLP